MDASVARAIFNSSMLRMEDGVPEIRRDDAALFTKTLLRTLNICTGRDIKVSTGQMHTTFHQPSCIATLTDIGIILTGLQRFHCQEHHPVTCENGCFDQVSIVSEQIFRTQASSLDHRVFQAKGRR